LRVLARREIWIAAGIGIVLLIPFAAMTYAFGRFNATLAMSQPLEANAANRVLAAGAASLAFTLATQPVPYIDGLRATAEQAVRMTPADGTIMFVGHRSAAFIFDVRALGNRPNLAVLRPEKLLLSFQQGREFGVAAKELPANAIEDMIFRYRVTTATVQQHFWDDLPPMRRWPRRGRRCRSTCH
jgi:hypothetical protein